MGQTFDVLAGLGIVSPELAIRLKNAVGFRDIAVHNYEAINWQIAHAIATRYLSDFKDFARSVIQGGQIVKLPRVPVDLVPNF